jgi:hypothetical protein
MTDTEIDKIERNYIAVAEQIDGSVIIDDAVYNAKIVGVEIVNFNGCDDDDDNKLVVIVDDGVAIHTRRFDIVYSRDFYAEAELERRRAERQPQAVA